MSTYSKRHTATQISTEKRVVRVSIDPNQLFSVIDVAGGSKAIAISPNTSALQARDSVLMLLSKSIPAAQRPDFIQKCQFFFLYEAGSDRTKDRMLRSTEAPWSIPTSSDIVLKEYIPDRTARATSFYSKDRLFMIMPFFGQHLESVIRSRENTNGIPNAVHHSFQYLAHHLEQEGVFRISGSAALVQQHVELWDTTINPPFLEGTDVHTVASFVKRFFADLPDSLLPYRDAFAILLVIAVLLFRPQGLLARKTLVKL